MLERGTVFTERHVAKWNNPLRTLPISTLDRLHR